MLHTYHYILIIKNQFQHFGSSTAGESVRNHYHCLRNKWYNIILREQNYQQYDSVKLSDYQDNLTLASTFRLDLVQ